MAKLKKNCMICGKEYETYKPNSKTCSISCRQKHNGLQHKRKGIYKNCEICGKEFYAQPCAIESHRFCSIGCTNKYFSIEFVGEKSNFYKNGNYQGRGQDWYKNRDLVRKRDNHTCKICNKENSNVVHHIIPYKICNHNEINNLITLCPNCHAKVHGHMKSNNIINDSTESINYLKTILIQD